MRVDFFSYLLLESCNADFSSQENYDTYNVGEGMQAKIIKLQVLRMFSTTAMQIEEKFIDSRIISIQVSFLLQCRPETNEYNSLRWAQRSTAQIVTLIANNEYGFIETPIC